MIDNLIKMLNKIKNIYKRDGSRGAAKDRLHLVLIQDRVNVSPDFLDLMKQEIIEVIKKYIDVDENAIDVHFSNKEGEDGENSAPALYANIPILNVKDNVRSGKLQQEVRNEVQKQDGINEEEKANKKTKTLSKEAKVITEKIKGVNSQKFKDDFTKLTHNIKDSTAKVAHKIKDMTTPKK